MNTLDQLRKKSKEERREIEESIREEGERGERA